MQLVHNKATFSWLDSADWLQHSEFRNEMIPHKVTQERLLAGALAGVCVVGVYYTDSLWCTALLN